MTEWLGTFVSTKGHRSYQLVGPEGAVTFDLRTDSTMPASEAAIVDAEGAWIPYDFAAHWRTPAGNDFVMPACGILGAAGPCFYQPSMSSARYLARRWTRAGYDDMIIWQELADHYDGRKPAPLPV